MKKILLAVLLLPVVAGAMEKKKEKPTFVKDMAHITATRKGGAAYHPITQGAWISMGKKHSFSQPPTWKVAVLTGVSWGILNNNFLTNWWYGKPVKVKKQK